MPYFAQLRYTSVGRRWLKVDEDLGIDVTKYRVCVADDCAEAADVLCEGLRLNGYEAVVARDGTEALDICAQGNIDLLLLDVLMPGIDGYEVCRRLKASLATRDIPVIFVTVKGSPQDITQGRDLGAVDYITKPYNLPMVMLRVDVALRSRKAQESSRIACEQGGETAHTDLLTGLPTREHLLQRLQEAIEEAKRYN
ncbi:MAG TPA: response regulator, partial [Candidatus Hydrogenedentes bacterium]|nr:response regulator [Candidatus Hydrogenedentota bacterium]